MLYLGCLPAPTKNFSLARGWYIKRQRRNWALGLQKHFIIFIIKIHPHYPAGFRSVVVITSALQGHLEAAEGRQFNPGRNHCFFSFWAEKKKRLFLAGRGKAKTSLHFFFNCDIPSNNLDFFLECSFCNIVLVHKIMEKNVFLLACLIPWNRPEYSWRNMTTKRLSTWESAIVELHTNPLIRIIHTDRFWMITQFFHLVYNSTILY